MDNENKPKPCVTASADSADDLPHVEQELQHPVTQSVSKETWPEEQKLPELRVTIKPMSAQEIAHFTSKINTDILTTKVGDTSPNAADHDESADQSLDPEQEYALDLSGYEARDQSAAEYSFKSTHVLDLSSKDIATNDSNGISSSILPEPNMVESDKAPSPTKSGFKIKLVRVHRRKPKYSFKCSVCDKIMHSVKEWNMHHRSDHSKIVLSCEDCGKGFQVPSSLRHHRYSHHGQPFICNTCQAKFTFFSRL